MDIQDCVRRLKSEPKEEAVLEVEHLRQSLTPDLVLINSMQPTVNSQEALSRSIFHDAAEHLFNNLEDNNEGGGADADAYSNADVNFSSAVGRLEFDDNIPPEQKSLHLPSSHLPSSDPLSKSELSLRIKQAGRYLAAIREAVAEKSYQYSHVIRAAPSKVVETRSRAVVKRISEEISFWSKVYCRAQSAMIRLAVTVT